VCVGAAPYGGRAQNSAEVGVRGRSIVNRTLRVTGGRTGVASLQVAGKEWLAKGGIRVAVFEDKSDTWARAWQDLR